MLGSLSGREAFAQFEDETKFADADLVAGLEGHLADDAMAVDVGAVAAAEVGQRDLLRARADQAVVPADVDVAQPQVAIGAAAE